MSNTHLRSIVGLLALCATIESFALTETVNGIEWTYTVWNGEASVGTTSATAVPRTTSGAITIPSTLGGYPVTTIGRRAFCILANLTSVTIPDNVTSIGSEAFYGCSGLTSVTIGNSVTNIGSDAFSYCSGLMAFAVGDGNPSYKTVSGLLLTKDEGTLVLGVNGAVTIPDTITSIGGSAFSGCSGLTSVTIGNSVTNIGAYAFRNCSGLTSVTIGNSVTSIGSYAFYNCSGLTSVTIPDRDEHR